MPLNNMRTSGEILYDELGYDPYASKHSASTNATLRWTVEKLDVEDRRRIKEIISPYQQLHSPIWHFGENACLELLLKTAMWITESGIAPEKIHEMVESYRLCHPKVKEDDLEDYEIGQLIG